MPSAATFSGTLICKSCGWVVLTPVYRHGVPRHSACGGLAVGYRTVAKAMGVRTLRDVLNASPERRARAFVRRVRGEPLAS